MQVQAIAVLSDVHGNRWALEAVLADVRARGLVDIVHLGDAAWGVLDPSGAATLLQECGALCIAGNQDRDVLDASQPGDSSASLRFTREQLTDKQLAWLASLPPTITLEDQVLLCHGTPDSDVTYLLDEVTPEGVRQRSPEAIGALLGEFRFPVTLCGHTHRQRIVRLEPDGRLVVNPGSVGLPAYSDDLPYWHAMESGSPHARYAILTRADTGWKADACQVDYDWHAAARTAQANGRPDWAHQLLHGTVARPSDSSSSSAAAAGLADH